MRAGVVPRGRGDSGLGGIKDQGFGHSGSGFGTHLLAPATASRPAPKRATDAGSGTGSGPGRRALPTAGDRSLDHAAFERFRPATYRKANGST